MLAIIFIAGIIILLMIALLVAYLDLRSTVEIMNKIMNDTIDFQKERYTACLDGWEKAIQSVKKVLSLNDRIIELNKQLYSKLYSDKEDDNNERE